uniref:Pectinesterase inhibitor domain-containing protein n=1 Tax=Fagus sylvatica TaxID=28930 RepID=A0A2N9I633_FAGSY
MAKTTPSSTISLIFILFLLLATAPEPSHSLSFSQYQTVVSLAHSLMTRVANLRASRGDLAGSRRAQLIADSLNLGLGSWGLTWSMGWDYVKNYAWREVNYAELYGVVSDMNELLRCVGELTRSDSDAERASWVGRNYQKVLGITSSLFKKLLKVFSQSSGEDGAERVGGCLLKDALNWGAIFGDCFKFKDLASQFYSNSSSAPTASTSSSELSFLLLGAVRHTLTSVEGDRGRNGQILPWPTALLFFPVLFLLKPDRKPPSLHLHFFVLLLFVSAFPLSSLLRPCTGGLRRSPEVARDSMGFLFFAGEIKSCCRWCDLQRSWMIRRQRVWDFILFINLSKLLLVESPKTRIAWHLMPWTIRFDLLSGCTYGNWVSSLLSVWTSPTAAALAIYRTVIKPCGYVP